MAIFTRKDIGDQALRGLIDDQRFAWQGTALHFAQGFKASVTRLQAIAINNFHAVPRQPRGTCTIKVLDQRPQHCCTIAYQVRRGVRLHPVEFVIERDQGSANFLFLVPIRRAYRGLDAKDHLAEDVIDSREQHGACVLLLGGLGKPAIQLVRSQDTFQCATHHHGQGTFLHKTCEHSAQHSGLLQSVGVEGLSVTNGEREGHLNRAGIEGL